MAILVSSVVRDLLTNVADMKARFDNAAVKSVLDDAAVNVVNFKHDANLVIEAFNLEANAPVQRLPDGGLALIDCVSNIAREGVQATPITQQNRNVFDAHVPDWTVPVDTKELQHFFYDPDTPTQFEVYPVPSAAFEIRINYAKKPKRIDEHNNSDVDVYTTGVATIPLPSEYQPAIYNFAMYRLYSGDDLDPMMAQTAMKYLNAFFQFLGVKQKAEYKIIEA